MKSNTIRNILTWIGIVLAVVLIMTPLIFSESKSEKIDDMQPGVLVIEISKRHDFTRPTTSVENASAILAKQSIYEEVVELHKLRAHPGKNPAFNDTKYKQRIAHVKGESLRAEYSALPVGFRLVIRTHRGGSDLNPKALRETIGAVLNEMPNLPCNKELTDLVFETFITETRAGSMSYAYSAKNWANYGIAQFRKDTAEHLLKWLKTNRVDSYNAVMSFYQPKKSMKDNLLSNVPFCIALTSQYYWYRVNDLTDKIETVEARAKLWKSVHNTSLGAGTINDYIVRVQKYYNAYLDETLLTRS